MAYDKDADRVKAIGEEARQMIGRTPGNIMAIRPLRQGVISDYMITEKMLHYFIQKAMGRQRIPETADRYLRSQRRYRCGAQSGGGRHLPGGSQGGDDY